MIGKNKKYTAMNVPVELLQKLKALKKANLAAYEKSMSYEEIIEILIEGVKSFDSVLYKYYKMIYETEFKVDDEESCSEKVGINIQKKCRTLHEAITEVLKAAGRSMTVLEISDVIQANGLYERSDGLPVPPNQVSARIKNYPNLFTVDRSVSPKKVFLKVMGVNDKDK